MKTLEYVMEHIEEIERDSFIDRRFTKRLLDFIPVDDWGKFQFTFIGSDKSVVKTKAWTEENVLNQLKQDVAFGIEKATSHRGISSCLMFDVVKTWCYILENGLDNIEYEDCWYGDKLFKAVDEFYGFGLVSKDTFDTTFYKEW